MCLGFIVPGVILGYGSAAIALLNGSSILNSLGILVATGLGVTLTGALWQGFAPRAGRAERQPSARDTALRAEQQAASPT